MGSDTFLMPKHGFTCFHCGETFTTPGQARVRAIIDEELQAHGAMPETERKANTWKQILDSLGGN